LKEWRSETLRYSVLSKKCLNLIKDFDRFINKKMNRRYYNWVIFDIWVIL
jgi:hypothetical protein